MHQTITKKELCNRLYFSCMIKNSWYEKPNIDIKSFLLVSRHTVIWNYCLSSSPATLYRITKSGHVKAILMLMLQ